MLIVSILIYYARVRLYVENNAWMLCKLGRFITCRGNFLLKYIVCLFMADTHRFLHRSVLFNSIAKRRFVSQRSKLMDNKRCLYSEHVK